MKWRALLFGTSTAAERYRNAAAGNRSFSTLAGMDVKTFDARTYGLAINEALRLLPNASADRLVVEQVDGAAEPSSSSAPAPIATDLRPLGDGTEYPDCIVYDVETKLCIPNAREIRRPDWQYCAREKDWRGMGISVICAIDTRDLVPRAFMDDNLDAFFALIDGRCVAGHSNHEFDNPLVEAFGAKIARSYDLLRHLRVACGEPASYTRRVTRGGRKVNDIARVNLGMQKSADGAMAPVLWQQGKVGELVDYCMRDVTIETRLILKLPYLIDPLTSTRVQLEVPK